MAKTQTFSSYNYVGKDGRYLSLTVTESVNVSANTSNINWTLSTSGGAVTYYDTFCLVKINGTQVFFSNGLFSAAGYSGWVGSANHPIDTEVWIDANGSENTCAKWGFSTSGTLNNVAHNADGSKSVTVTFLVGIYYYKVVDCGGSFTLETIDRIEPIITQNNPTSITYNSCSISATSNVNCSKWWWRKKESSSDNWGSWTEINSSGTSKTVSATGLSPNTSYDFEWYGKKESNGVDGYSEVKTITTLGASLINSASDIYIDIDSPSITYNITVYSSSFYHKLVLTKGNSSITIDLGTKAAKTSDYTHFFTNSQKNTLLSWVGSTSFTANDITVTLKTYTNSNYNTQIGSNSVYSGTIRAIIREANAIPSLTVGGYEDINSTTIATTGNKTYIIPEASILRINNIQGEIKLGASISSIVIKDVNRNQTKTVGIGNYQWGTVSKVSSLFEITLTDSRGLTATVSLLIKIYRKGILVRNSDYNYWYDVLYEQYHAKRYDGTYFVSGTSNANFNLQRVAFKDLAEAENINSSENGIFKHVNNIPISSGSYYYDERNIINNIKSLTSSVNLDTGDLIEASLKTELDNNFTQLGNIVLFNLVPGAHARLIINYPPGQLYVDVGRTITVDVEQINYNPITNQSTVYYSISVYDRGSGSYWSVASMEFRIGSSTIYNVYNTTSGIPATTGTRTGRITLSHSTDTQFQIYLRTTILSMVQAEPITRTATAQIMLGAYGNTTG